MKNSEANLLRAEAKELYLKIEDKAALKMKLVNKYEASPVTVKQNWFGNVIGIPKGRIKDVIEDLKETLKDQENATATIQ